MISAPSNILYWEGLLTAKPMRTIIRTFDELTTRELYALLTARTAVFVVEQHCAYQELDGIDFDAIHVWLEDDDGQLLAYLRAFPITDDHTVVQIGRVLTIARGKGLGHAVMEAGMAAIKARFPVERMTLDAQCYAQGFYEKEGFSAEGDPFDEDGIAHIRMVRNIP